MTVSVSWSWCFTAAVSANPPRSLAWRRDAPWVVPEGGRGASAQVPGERAADDLGGRGRVVRLAAVEAVRVLEQRHEHLLAVDLFEVLERVALGVDGGPGGAHVA